MSIPMIKKHSFGKKHYLMPSEMNAELIRETVYARERFAKVTELIRKID